MGLKPFVSLPHEKFATVFRMKIVRMLSVKSRDWNPNKSAMMLLNKFAMMFLVSSQRIYLSNSAVLYRCPNVNRRLLKNVARWWLEQLKLFPRKFADKNRPKNAIPSRRE